MMRRRSVSVVLASLLVVLLHAGAARAESIDFLGVGKGAAVTVSGPLSETVFAGEINWAFIGGTPTGFADTFYSYCVDFLSYLTDPQSVTVKSTDGLSTGSGGTTTVADAGQKAAWLVNTYADSIHTSGTSAQAAALQVAIWEAIYDTTNSLSGGVFSLVTTGAIRDQANTYLAALYSSDYRSASAIWLDATKGQDQITRVPEPATVVLLGLGLGVLALRRRAVAH